MSGCSGLQVMKHVNDAFDSVAVPRWITLNYAGTCQPLPVCFAPLQRLFDVCGV